MATDKKFIIKNGLIAADLTYPTTDGRDKQAIITDATGNLTFGDAIAETVEMAVKNTSGGALTKGTPIFQTGTSGQNAEVTSARADNLQGRMPAVGILLQDLASGEEGYAIILGRLQGIDTSSYSEGAVLYVGLTGGLTTTKPTGQSNVIQNIAVVNKVHATSGSVIVYGSGRGAATPALNEGNIFIGDSNNESSIITLNTANVPESVNLYYTTTRVDSDIDARVTKSFVDNLNVDADTLDNLNSTQFLRSDIPDSASGIITFSNHIEIKNLNSEVNFLTNDGDNDGTRIVRYSGDALRVQYAANSMIFDALDNTEWQVRNDSDTVVFGIVPGNPREGTSIYTYGQAQYKNTDGTNQIIVDGNWSSGKGRILLADSAQIALGSSADLVIRHNGSNSFIQDNGTGALYIDASTLYFRNAAGTETMATFNTNGGAHLRFDNAVKMSTTSTGIDVTGQVLADSATIAGDLTVDTNVLHVDATNDRVGIGTATPSYKLDVQSGTSDWPLRVYSSDDKAGIIVQDNDTANYIISRNGRMSLGSSSDAGGTNLTIKNTTGHIGIGTTDPSTALHIADSAADGGLLITGASGNEVVRLEPVSGAPNRGQLLLKEGTGNATQVRFTTQASTPNFILGNDVGIGTATPAVNLHLYQSSSAANVRIETAQADGSAWLYLRNDARNWSVGAVGGLNDNFVIRDNNASEYRLSITTTGKVGIGVTNPTEMLRIEGGSGLATLAVTNNPFTIGDPSAANMAFDVNEIQTRSNGSAIKMLLNKNGGSVVVGGTADNGRSMRVEGDFEADSAHLEAIVLDKKDGHIAYQEGAIWYDTEHATLNYYSDDSDVVHEIGIEEHQKVYNNTGATITKGSPLYFSGNYTSGTHDVPTVGLADATDVNAYNAQGLAASDIANGSYGYCIISGQLDGVDTSGLSAGTNFFVGLSAGAVQNASPVYPNYPMCLGWVVKSHATDGILLVNQQNHSVNSFRVRTSAHIGDDLQVDGNLTVLGTQTIASSENISIGGAFNYLNGGDTIGETNTSFVGSGLDDAYFAGHYSGTTTNQGFYVKIDGTGATDTFEWGYDSASPQATGVSITGDDQELAQGISINFGATTGHTSGDKWTGSASPVNTDTGFFTNRNTGTSGVGYTHPGFFFDVSQDKWILLDEYDPEPSGTIDLTDSSVSYGILKAASFEGDLTGDISGNADTVDNKHAGDFTLDYVTDNGNTTTNSIEVQTITTKSNTQTTTTDLAMTDNAVIRASSSLALVGNDITLRTHTGSASSGGTGGTATRMHVEASTGYVGIGTVTPTPKLHIHDAGTNKYMFGVSNNNSQHIQMYLSDNNFARLDFDGGNFGSLGSSSHHYFISYSSSHSSVPNDFAMKNARGGIGFYTGAGGTSSERIHIDSDGNVGINDSTPEKTLDVVGEGRFKVTSSETFEIKVTNDAGTQEALTLSTTYDRDTGIKFLNGVSNEYWTIWLDGAAGDDLMFGNPDDSYAVAFKQSTGHVGIGTSNPVSMLEVDGTITGQRLHLTDDGNSSPTLLIETDDASPWALAIKNDTYSTTDTMGLLAYQSNDGAVWTQVRGSSAYEDWNFQQHNGTTARTAFTLRNDQKLDMKSGEGDTAGTAIVKIPYLHFANQEDDNIPQSLESVNGANLYYDHNFYPDAPSGHTTAFSDYFAGDGGGFAYYGGDQGTFTAIYDTENTQYAIADWRGLNVVQSYSGTSSSQRAVYVEYNVSNTEADFAFAQRIDANLSGSVAATADREQGGLYVTVDSTNTGGDTSNEHRIYGGYFTTNQTGDADYNAGIYARALASHSSGQATTVIGVDAQGEADQASGATVSNVYGVRSNAYVDNAGSSASNMYAVYGRSYQYSDGGAITSAHGGYFEIEANNTTAGNNYGTAYGVRVEIDNNTGRTDAIGTSYLFYGNYAGDMPTTHWGLYISDDTRNYLNGQVLIGGTNGSYGKLQVNQEANNDESGIGLLAASEGRSMRIYVDESRSFIHSGDGGGGELVLNTGGGNVGIGTGDPGERLHVEGGAIFAAGGYFQKTYGSQEILLKAQDSGGTYSIYHTINDSQGNYNIMVGVDGAGQYTATGDGTAKILMQAHGLAGHVSLNAGPTGTGGNTASYRIGLTVDGGTNAVYIGDPNDNIGLQGTAGYKFSEGTGTLFASDVTGDTTYTSPGQLAIKRANDNPFVSFHANDGSRNGYIQSVLTGPMQFINSERGDYRFLGGTTTSDPARLLIETLTHTNTNPGDIYGQLQFKVSSANGVSASGISGTTVDTIAMITAQDFRNGTTSNEDSGLGFYTTNTGSTLTYRGGISNAGRWFVGSWNNDNNTVNSSLLNVNGGSYFAGDIVQLNGSPEYHFATSSASHYNWRVAVQEVVDGGFEIASGTQSAGTGAASDTYTNRFVIAGATGYVGLGTNTPGAPLDIETAGSTADGTYFSTFTINNTGSSTWSRIRFDRSGVARWGVSLGTDDKFKISNLYTNGSTANPDDQALVIDNNSDVGIGTASVDNRLHVYDPTTNVVAQFESGDNEAWINIKDNTSNTYGVLLGMSTSDSTLFKVADNGVNERLRMLESGFTKFSKNGSTPQVRMDVDGHVMAHAFIRANSGEEPNEFQANGSLGKWVCLEGDTVTVAACLFNTIIYEEDPMTGNVSFVMETGPDSNRTFTAVEGRIYYSNGKPINMVGEDSHHSIAPFSAAGRYFGFVSSRYNPQIIRAFAISGNITVNVYRDGGITGGTIDYTFNVEANHIGEVSIAVDSATYIIEVVGGTGVLTRHGSAGGDSDVLMPASRIRYKGDNSFGLQTVKSIFSYTTASSHDNMVAYMDDLSEPVILSAIGDGAGGDTQTGMPLQMLANNYLIPHNLNGYSVAAIYPNTDIRFTYYNGTTWITHDTHSMDGTLLDPNPVNQGDLDTGGSGEINAGNRCIWVTANAPFILKVNDDGDDEYDPVGWLTEYYNAAPTRGDHLIIYNSAGTAVKVI